MSVCVVVGNDFCWLPPCTNVVDFWLFLHPVPLVLTKKTYTFSTESRTHAHTEPELTSKIETSLQNVETSEWLIKCTKMHPSVNHCPFARQWWRCRCNHCSFSCRSNVRWKSPIERCSCSAHYSWMIFAREWTVICVLRGWAVVFCRWSRAIIAQQWMDGLHSTGFVRVRTSQRPKSKHDRDAIHPASSDYPLTERIATTGRIAFGWNKFGQTLSFAYAMRFKWERFWIYSRSNQMWDFVFRVIVFWSNHLSFSLNCTINFCSDF